MPVELFTLEAFDFSQHHVALFAFHPSIRAVY